MRKKQPTTVLNNSRGALLLVMVVIIGLVLFLFSVAASTQLIVVAKEANRVNHSLRLLNVMHEFGQEIGRARALGRAIDRGEIASCPTGTFLVTSLGKRLCLPSTSVASFCIAHNDGVGQPVNFCATAVTINAQLEAPRSDGSEIVFNIEQQRSPSFVSRLLRTLGLQKSYAVSCAAEPWRCGGVPSTPPGAGPYPPITVPQPSGAIPSLPPAATPGPGAGGTQNTAGGTLNERNNMEGWVNTSLAWPNPSPNEIRTPQCNSADQDFLGCMRCARAEVTCITLQMCPDAASGLSCTTPYSQQIAVYD